MTKALVLTNHLHAWAGSEILALEVAEALAEHFHVDISANVFVKQTRAECEKIGATVVLDPSTVDIRDYEFIWAQHFVLPLCRGFFDLQEFDGSLNSIHLSPFASLELAPLSYTSAIGANLIANSAETKDKISELVEPHVEPKNFRNATLRKFQEKNVVTTSSEHPKSVLVVSNHPPTEVLQACEVLKSMGVKVTNFGVGTSNYRRLTKEDIQEHDVTISIGKTVQYSILARRPVFCYDHFGGPGYISLGNVHNALEYNFSGRCCRRQLPPEDIVGELMQGYAGAFSSCNTLYSEFHNAFDLELFLDILRQRKTKLDAKSALLGPAYHTAQFLKETYVAMFNAKMNSIQG